jgi:hypothetical protein
MRGAIWLKSDTSIAFFELVDAACTTSEFTVFPESNSSYMFMVDRDFIESR